MLNTLDVALSINSTTSVHRMHHIAYENSQK